MRVIINNEVAYDLTYGLHFYAGVSIDHHKTRFGGNILQALRYPRVG